MDLFKLWLSKLKNIQELPTKEFLMFFMGKFFGAMAFGILIASYIAWNQWILAGWALMLFAIVFTLPGIGKTFCK